MLDEGEFISAPGVFDPLSARVAESCGARTLYMTGYGVSASLLGKPDDELVSYREMVDRVRSICEVTDAPLIADGDTGFGGLANVRQAVQGYEAAGASAIRLEDQQYPKRCGHTNNRKVIPVEDMVSKVKIATESRASSDFLIIARTDARTEYGLDDAIRRCDPYINAGADILFLESPESKEEMRTIAERFLEIPKLANMVCGGETPLLSDSELKRTGIPDCDPPCLSAGGSRHGDARSHDYVLEKGVEHENVADLEDLNTLVDFPAIWALDETD